MKTTNSMFKSLFMIACLNSVLTQSFAQQGGGGKGSNSSGYASVNGLKIYYEVQGEGQPIVLLHGAYLNINMNWGQLIPELAKTRQVIAIELQGHGRTADIDRPFTYQGFASDVAGVLKFLKIENADILGYSLGGTTAYQLAIQNPELVRNLIIISSTYKSDGWQPEVRNAFKAMQPAFLENTPLKSEYIKIAPDAAHWEKFATKVIALNNMPYDLGDEKIKSIKAPTLLIMGDNDGTDKTVLAHTYQLLGGAVFGDMVGVPKSQLAILPGKTHVSMVMDAPAIANLVNTFLK